MTRKVLIHNEKPILHLGDATSPRRSRSALAIGFLSVFPWLLSALLVGGHASADPSVSPVLSGLSQPSGIDVSASGDVYFTEDGGRAVGKLPVNTSTPQWLVTGADFGYVAAALDASNNLFYSSYWNGTIFQIPNGTSSPFAFANLSGSGPRGIDVDALGNVYVAMFNYNQLLKISSDGTVTILLNESGPSSVESLAVDSLGTVYYDLGNNIYRVPAGSNTSEAYLRNVNASRLFIDERDSLFFFDERGVNSTVGSMLMRFRSGCATPEALLRLPTDFPQRVAVRNNVAYVTFYGAGYIGSIPLPPAEPCHPFTGRIQVVGGRLHGGPDVSQNVVADFGAAPLSWTNLAAFPEPRYGIGVASVGNLTIVAGGFNTTSGSLSNRTDVLDSTTGTWTRGGDLPAELVFPAMAEFGGRVYLMGGNDALGKVNTTYSFNVSSGIWSQVASFGLGRDRAAAVVVNDSIWLIGGNSDLGTSLDTVDVYTPASDSWTPGPSMPEVRNSLAATRLGTAVVVVGGHQNPGTYLDSVIAYEPGFGWVPMTSMPTARSELVVVAAGTALLAIGGQAGSSMVTDIVEILDFARNEWSDGPSIPIGVTGAGAVVIDDSASTPNRAPIFTGLGETLSVAAGSGQWASVDIEGAFTDPDGDSLTIQAESPTPDIEVRLVGLTLEARSPPGATWFGVGCISLRASDGALSLVSNAFCVDVSAIPINHAPEFMGIVKDLSLPVGSQSLLVVNLTGHFIDPDGEILNYTLIPVAGAPGWAFLEVSFVGDSLLLQPLPGATWTGDACAHVRAEDSAHLHADSNVFCVRFVPGNQTVPPPPMPANLELAPIVVAGVIVLVIAGSAVALGTEVGLYVIVGGVAAAFRSLRPDRRVSDFTPGRLYQVIFEDPGIHYSALCKRANLGHSATTHNLQILEAEGLIKRVQRGVKVVFYVTDQPVDEDRIRFGGRVLKVLRVIQSRGGINQTEIALKLEMRKPAVSKAVAKLQSAGRIEQRRSGKGNEIELWEKGSAPP